MIQEADLESKRQKFAKEYPFFGVHKDVVEDYSAKNRLSPQKATALLTYSMYLDYPAAIPGIAYLVGISSKLARFHIDHAPDRYEKEIVEIEETLENKRDLRQGEPVPELPKVEVAVPGPLSQIDKQEMEDLQEHVGLLKAQGYSTRAQLVETLFMRGFDAPISQLDFANILGRSRQQVNQICRKLEKEQFPLPQSFSRPRPKIVIGAEEGTYYSVLSRWITAQYGMSPHVLSTYLYRLGGQFPNHFHQGAVNKPWKISAWGLHLLAKRIEEAQIPDKFTKIGATQLMEEFNISYYPIKRIRELKKKYPREIRGGGRGQPWYATEKGAQLLNEVLEPLKPSADYSEYLVLPLARKLGLTRFRVRKTFDELAKLYPDDIKKGSGQRKGGKGKDWIVTQAGRQAIDKALEDYQAGKST